MKWNFTLLFVAVLFFVFGETSAQTLRRVTYYVSASSGNDGNTGLRMTEPVKSLQVALGRLNSVDSDIPDATIVLDKGTYITTDGWYGDVNREVTFLLQRKEDGQAGKKLRVLGGYDFTTGTRDISSNPTILSGNTGDPDNDKDNSYHVVVIKNVSNDADSLVLDGLIIQDGRADDVLQTSAAPNESGGGLLIFNTGVNSTQASQKFLIKNCIFRNNFAYEGAAVFNFQGAPNIENCVFENNLTDYTPNLTESNHAAGIRNFHANLTLQGCVFNNNKSGDGLLIYDSNVPANRLVIHNCTFYGNVNSRNYLTITKTIWQVNTGSYFEMANSIFYNNTRLDAGNSLYIAGVPDSRNPIDRTLYNFSHNIYAAPSDLLYATDTVWAQLDPQFTNPQNPKGSDGKWFTEDDGLHINPCSIDNPALDGGLNSFWTSALKTDIAGNARITGNRIDLGSYESPGFSNFWIDKDGDGYGANDAQAVSSRCAPAGYVNRQGDCNNNDKTTYPGAPEICGDGKDNDCNGLIDDVFLTLNIPDKDGDGYGDANAPFVLYCGLQPGYVSVGGDCDDGDNTVYPNAPELCDGKDNDCNGQVDDGIAKPVWYLDSDGDGFGNPAITEETCTQPNHYVLNNTDCDDANDQVWRTGSFYTDNDGDGYTASVYPTLLCYGDAPPAGYVANPGAYFDCNDNNKDVWRAATLYVDADGDGYDGGTLSVCYGAAPPAGYALSSKGGDCNDNDKTIYAGAPELCDGKDNDCNGSVDEGCSVLTVASLTLVNAATDLDLSALSDGMTINLATIPGRAINIRANTSPAKVGSVRFVLTGTQAKTQTENLRPYALFGDSPQGNYNPWTPQAGSYTLTVTPFSKSDGKGKAGTALTVSFTVVDNASTLAGFTLVNAQTDKDIGPLTEGQIIDLSVTPSISVRADVVSGAKVGSVRFALNANASYQTENVTPFAIAGDNPQGNYLKWNIAPGAYTLTATPFSKDDAKGTAGMPISVAFTVIRSQLTTNTGSGVSKEGEGQRSQSRVYPNPTTGVFTLQLQNKKAETARVLVLDGKGSVVGKRQVSLVQGSQTFSFNLAGKSNGLYLVKLTSETGTQTFKVLLEQ